MDHTVMSYSMILPSNKPAGKSFIVFYNQGVHHKAFMLTRTLFIEK